MLACSKCSSLVLVISCFCQDDFQAKMLIIFSLIFPSHECSKLYNALIVQSQREFLVQMWDPASSKTFLYDCAVCRCTGIREFVLGIMFEKQGKKIVWLVHIKLILT